MALVVFAAGLILCFLSSFAELQRFEHAPKPNDSLSFLVVGDWGRRGAFNQSQVATQMGVVGEKLGIDFVVSTGDNFYDNGLTGVDDRAFEESFTKVYTAKSLQKQWYAVLGNHDYRGDVLAQLSPVLRKIDTRWLCMRSFVVNCDIAEFFFVDTNPFVEKYWTKPKNHTYDWREVAPRDEYVQTVLKDLESALRESTADWKIVIGHHTIRSVGHHGDTKEIVDLILPLLREYNVDFYMNGHDHCLEHISDTDSALQFLTSGAGSKAWRGDAKEDSQAKLFYDGQGFMSVELSQTNADLVFYDVSGLVLHKWSMSKHLHSTY